MLDWLLEKGVDVFGGALNILGDVGMKLFSALKDFFFGLLDKSFDVVSNWLNL